MPRYIDTDALCTHFKILYEHAQSNGMYNHAKLYDRAFRLVVDAPTADVIAVVRCKDCKHYDDGICQLHSEEPDQYGGGFNMDMLENDFCSYGERKEKSDG